MVENIVSYTIELQEDPKHRLTIFNGDIQYDAAGNIIEIDGKKFLIETGDLSAEYLRIKEEKPQVVLLPNSTYALDAKVKNDSGRTEHLVVPLLDARVTEVTIKPKNHTRR